MQNKSQTKKILIDARMLGADNAGIGRSIEELIKGLVKLDIINEYHLFLTKENFDQVKDLPSNWRKVLVDVRWYTLKEQIIIPREIRKIKPDLVYFPHFNVPLLISASRGWPLPFKKLTSASRGWPLQGRRVKYIVTIHDLIWLKYPRPRKEISTLGPVFYWVKNLFSKIVFRSAVKRAVKIVAPTEFTKNDVVDYFGVDDGKVEVIPWGAGSQKPELENQKSEIADNTLKKCYNINKPYLLYVGSSYPHKNLTFLLEVFKKVNLDLQLVLVGKDSFFYKILKKKSEELELGDKVIFTDYVDDDKLNLLYKRATAFVFPTLVEGFGFPPLEAMQHGAPVVSSNTTCLPEVLGGAALYFDPNNKEELENKILSVVGEQRLREDLVNKGFEQVEKYDWSECASKYLNVFSRGLKAED